MATIESQLTAQQAGWLRQYDGLDALVGRLKQAAIDAHMVENGWRMPTTVVSSGQASANPYSESGYWKTDSTASAMSPDKYFGMGRPGASGMDGGTGEWRSELAGYDPVRLDYTSEFNEIRSAIDRYVEKFLRLPQPQAAAGVANLYGSISDQLDPDHGTMTSSIEAIRTNSAALNSTAAETYKTSFLNNFGSVLDGYCGLAALLAQYMGAQAGMWAAARADLVGTVINSIDAYDSLARKGPYRAPRQDWELVIRVAKVALDVGALFVSPAGVAAKAMGAGLVLLNNVTTEEDAKHCPGSTTADIFNSIYKAGLAAVNTQIEDVEHRIYASAGASMDAISSPSAIVRQNWQLPIVVADLSGEQNITWCRDSVSHICDTHMPNIVAQLNQLIDGSREMNDDIVSSVLHDNAIGRGHYGPALAVQELNDMFCDLLGFFMNQVEGCAVNLWDAYEVARNANEAARARLAASSANLEALASPNGYSDPWRHDSTPAPTPEDQQMYREWVSRMSES